MRRHVGQLHQAGLVRIEKAKGRVGHPTHMCVLTDMGNELFPKGYDRFSVELIQSVVLLNGDSKLEQLLETRKSQLLKKYAGRMAGKSRPARVREVTRILNEEGYMAESSPLNSGVFRITEHNCPLIRIARQYPRVCQPELCLLGQLLGAEVKRETHMLNGDSKCSYLVQFPASRKAAAPGC